MVWVVSYHLYHPFKIELREEIVKNVSIHNIEA